MRAGARSQVVELMPMRAQGYSDPIVKTEIEDDEYSVIFMTKQ